LDSYWKPLSLDLQTLEPGFCPLWPSHTCHFTQDMGHLPEVPLVSSLFGPSLTLEVRPWRRRCVCTKPTVDIKLTGERLSALPLGLAQGKNVLVLEAGASAYQKRK
jgi:hypothetical protein